MDSISSYLLPVFIIGGIAIAFAAYLARDVMRRDTGTPEMRAVSDLIFEGAMAYMRRQYQTIAMLAVVVTVVLGIIVYLVENEHQQTRAIVTAGAFLLWGVPFGFVRVHRNVRRCSSQHPTAASARNNLGEALTVALRGGAVSGFLVVALSLMGVSAIYGIVYQFAEGALPTVAETRTGSSASRLAPASSRSLRS